MVGRAGERSGPCSSCSPLLCCQGEAACIKCGPDNQPTHLGKCSFFPFLSPSLSLPLSFPLFLALYLSLSISCILDHVLTAYPLIFINLSINIHNFHVIFFLCRRGDLHRDLLEQPLCAGAAPSRGRGLQPQHHRPYARQPVTAKSG